MPKHLHRNLREVERLLFSMGGMVEESIEKANRALEERNIRLAREVRDNDDAIDALELRIDDECLKLLALYQPVAEDLRFLSTVMKINNDFERMADLAANVAKRAIKISNGPDFALPSYFPTITRSVIQMVRDSLRAFIERDSISARRICVRDEDADQLRKNMVKSLVEYMKQNTEHVEFSLQLLWASRDLERIADHATNIGEDIVYLVEGEVIRHQSWEFPDTSDGSELPSSSQ